MSAFFWICFLSDDQFQSSSFFSCSENMWGKNRVYLYVKQMKKNFRRILFCRRVWEEKNDVFFMCGIGQINLIYFLFYLRRILVFSWMEPSV